MYWAHNRIRFEFFAAGDYLFDIVFKGVSFYPSVTESLRNYFDILGAWSFYIDIEYPYIAPLAFFTVNGVLPNDSISLSKRSEYRLALSGAQPGISYYYNFAFGLNNVFQETLPQSCFSYERIEIILKNVVAMQMALVV